MELAALSACARWGWRRIHTIFASTTEELAYTCCFMTFLGFFGALRSGQRLDAQLLLAFKRAVFAGAGRLLSDVCQRTPAVVFAALAAHHLMLALSLDDLGDQASGISEM